MVDLEEESLLPTIHIFGASQSTHKNEIPYFFHSEKPQQFFLTEVLFICSKIHTFQCAILWVLTNVYIHITANQDIEHFNDQNWPVPPCSHSFDFWPLATTSLFFVPKGFLCTECHITRAIQIAAFVSDSFRLEKCIWNVSVLCVSFVFPRFYWWVVFPCMHILQSFIHSLVDEHLGCFTFGDLGWNHCKYLRTGIYVKISFHFSWIMWIVRSHDKCLFNFIC